MNIIDIIGKKKRNNELTKEEIYYFIDAYTKEEIAEYQASALLMAIWFNGMTDEETYNLTMAMKNSGDVLDLSDIPGLKIDKHSTGGVGDKTSLVLVPLLATFGLKVAKMSGRGLGFTGGTLDKLESFKDFDIHLSEERFKEALNNIGAAIIGQTANLTPADKKLYALRDVTETVDSLPLITASIMSKKLALGSDIIILDVKYGKGAFMKTVEEAKALAKSMVRVGQMDGKKVRAFITNMNEPLGYAIGNTLEIEEAIATLRAEGPEDFTMLIKELTAQFLLEGELAKTKEEAFAMIDEKLQSGEAFDRFVELVEFQGGSAMQVKDPETLPHASKITELKSEVSGYVSSVDSLTLGIELVELGGGRHALGDEIDHGVGIVITKKVGQKVEIGETLAYIHHEELPTKTLDKIKSAFAFSKTEVAANPLVEEII